MLCLSPSESFCLLATVSSFLGSGSSPNLGGGTWGGAEGTASAASQPARARPGVPELLPCVLETSCCSKPASFVGRVRGGGGQEHMPAQGAMVGSTQHRALPIHVPYGHAEPSQIRQDPWLCAGKERRLLTPVTTFLSPLTRNPNQPLPRPLGCQARGGALEAGVSRASHSEPPELLEMGAESRHRDNVPRRTGENVGTPGPKHLRQQERGAWCAHTCTHTRVYTQAHIHVYAHTPSLQSLGAA